MPNILYSHINTSEYVPRDIFGNLRGGGKVDFQLKVLKNVRTFSLGGNFFSRGDLSLEIELVIDSFKHSKELYRTIL